MPVCSVKLCKTIVVIAACAVLVACASGPGRIKAPTASGAMFYGSIELPAEVRDDINWVMIFKDGEVYVPPFKTPIKARVFPNGDFYMENVEAGTYYVHHVVAGFEAFYFYPADISEAKTIVQEQTTDISPGTLAYLGHYRIHNWKRGFQSKMSPKVGSVRFLPSTPGAGPEPLANFMNHSSLLTAGSGTFSLKRTRTKRAERQVLEQVLSEVQGTGWEKKIERRLREVTLARRK